MSLLEKQSLYDRHSRETLGTSVGNNMGGPNPSDGNYYTENGNVDSPFVTKGGTGDHMKDLLTQNVISNNTGVTYQPSPILSTNFQDLDGGTDVFSGQPLNSTRGQFGGPYKNIGPIGGYY